MNEDPKSLFVIEGDLNTEFSTLEYEVKAEYSYVEPRDGRRYPTTKEDVDNYRKANYKVSRRFVTGWETI